MAQKKIIKQLEVLITEHGAAKVSAAIENINKKTRENTKAQQDNSKAQNTRKRIQEGTAKANLAEGKAFSRQSQGLGGLVRAYATVAANIFAISSAFLALKRVADFESMTKSAENFGAVMGTNALRLTRQVQEASRGALTLAQSLEIANRAASINVRGDQLTKLTEIGTKAAQTFGGSTEQAMNRMINAVLRGRTELVALIGITISMEEATSKYAAAIGKTANELSTYERQQAVINSLLEEGQNRLGAVTIDPNPYEQLSVNLRDIAVAFTSILHTPLNNFLKSISDSTTATVLALGTLVAYFAKTLTPSIEEFSAAATKREKYLMAAYEKSSQIEEQALKEATAKQRQAYAEDFRNLKIHGKKKIAEASKLGSILKSISNKEFAAPSIKGTQLESDIQNIIAKIEKFKTRIQKLQAEMAAKGGTFDMSSITAKTLPGTPGPILQIAQEKGIEGLEAYQAGLLKIVQGEEAVQQEAIKTGKVVEQTGSIFARAKRQAVLGILTFQKDVAATKVSMLDTFQNRGVLAGLSQISTHWRNIIAQQGVATRGAKLYATAVVTASTAMSLLSTITNKAFGWFAIISMGIMLLKGLKSWIQNTFGLWRDSLAEVEEKMDAVNEVIGESARKNYELSNIVKNTTDPYARAAAVLQFMAGRANDVVTAVRELNAEVDKSSLEGRLEAANREIEDLRRRALELQTKDGWFNVGLSKDEEDLLKRYNNRIKELTNLSIDLRARLNVLPQTAAAAAASTATLLASEIPNIRKMVEEGFFPPNFTKTFKQQLLTSLAAARAEVGGINFGEGSLLEEAITGGQDPAEIFQKLTDIWRTNPAAVENFGSFLANVMNIFGTSLNSANSALNSLKEANKEFATVIANLNQSFMRGASNSEYLRYLSDLDKKLKELKDVDISEFINTAITSDMKKAYGLEGLGEDEVRAKISSVLLTEKEKAMSEALVKVREQVLKIELENAKTQEKRSETAEALVANMRSRQGIEEQQLDIQRQLLNAQINSLRTRIDTVVTDKDEERVLNAQLSLLIAQRNEITNTLALRNNELEIQQALLKINGEIIGSQQNLLNNRLGGLKILKETTDSWEMQANLNTKINSLQYTSHLLQIRAYENQIATVKASEEDVIVADAKVAALNEQIKLEEYKMVQLQKQYALEQRLLDIRSEEQRRDTSRGLNPFAASFESYKDLIELEYYNMILASKSAAEKWVDVTKKGLEGSIDSLVDELTSGDFDFVSLREAIKESFRTAIGDMVKENLKTLAMGILSGRGGETPQASMEEIAGKIIAENPLQAAAFDTMAQLDNVRNQLLQYQLDVLNQIAAKSGAEGFTGQMPTVNAEAPSLESAVLERVSASQEEGAQKITSEQKQAGDKIVAQDKAGVKALIGAIGQGTNSLIGSIMNGLYMLASVFMTQSTSNTAASVLSVAGTAATGQAGPIKHATGGLVTRPTNAIIGEGSRPEAVVPLPNNREIPVKMTGGGNSVNINQSFNFENADASAIPQLRMAAKQIKQETLAALMQEINKGGAIAKTTGRR